MFGDETQKIDPGATDFSLADQKRMEFDNPRMKNLHKYLSGVVRDSYRDQLLLSNAIFAKHDLPLSALGCYLEGKEAERVSFLFCLKKFLHYFFKSFGWLVFFWAQGLAHRFSRQKFVPESEKPLTLIDIFLMPEQIAQTGDLNDRYFPGLEAKLKSKGINYAYVPKFFGTDHPMLYYKMFLQMKEKGRPVLSGFQLLGMSDYLKMLMFVPMYPLRVLRKIRQLGGSREDKLLRFFLWDTMDHTAVKNYARLLFGQCISKMSVPVIKCISWYENQSQDKNFYKGLRLTPGKVKIYGAQLYPWPPTLLNLHVDVKEAEYGLIPDRVLVNGRYYLRQESSLDFKLGPSMRYARLFQVKVNARGKTALLVLMPYFDYEIDKILEIIDEAELSAEIFIKFHPTTDRKKYAKRLQGKMQIVEDDLYVLFGRVGCVMGAATGALVEAACLGIPVINVKTGLGLGHNYMPQYGKGIIWENASSGIEILRWINKFQISLLTESEKIRSVADKYKKTLFCEPTNKKIDEAFELGE